LLGTCLLAVLALVGCGTGEGNITLYQGGGWRGDFDFTIPRTMLLLTGGEAALDAALEEGMGAEMITAREEDVQFSWQKTRSDQQAVTYRSSMAGSDLDALNAPEDGIEVWVEEGPEGKRVIHFRFTPDAMFTDTEGMLTEFAFSLTGGEIISSNADRVEGGTAAWYNLSGWRTAEAVLTEAPTSALGGLVPALLGGLAFAGVVAVGIVAFLALRADRGAKAKPSPVPVATLCAQCGARNALTAKFCIKCGKPLTG